MLIGGATFANHSTVVIDCGYHVVVILIILCLIFCDCIVVVMWSLNCNYLLWSQFVVTILLCFCSACKTTTIVVFKKVQYK